ncbi:MAG: hypothetical protein VYA30_02660 [Myxococcota bacterium]|nr:hypothetical protein [Myxococcota bacterium]
MMLLSWSPTCVVMAQASMDSDPQSNQDSMALPTVHLSSVPPTPRGLENLTTGIRFGGAHLSLAQSKSNPNILYLGTQHGRVNISRDGGRTWSESTILTSRGRFFGSIRPSGSMTGILDRWLSPKPVSLGRLSGVRLPSRLTNLDANSGDTLGVRTGSDLNPGDPLVGDLTGLESAKNSNASGALQELQTQLFLPVDGGGSGGGAGGGNSLAVGLRSGAPWLAYQVRRKRNWAVGISLKQSLVLKGSSGTNIRHLDIHPSNPDLVLAATDDGLRLSTDGGFSWPLVLSGVSSRERQMNHVLRSRYDSNLIYVGSRRGLHVSRDGGESFERATHRFVARSDIRWIEEHSANPNIIYVGADWGLLRTDNGGRDYKLVHRSPWPTLSLVRQVRVEPASPERVWLATADGLLVSRDNGFSFERNGRGFFTGKDIKRISFGMEPGHVIVATIRDLWETRDAGETWQVAYFGAIQWDVRTMIADRSRANSVLIATTAEVLRFGPKANRPIDGDDLIAYRRQIASEPDEIEVLHKALKRAGLFRPQLVKYRKNSRLMGLLPDLVGALRWAQYDTDRAFSNQLYQLEPINLRGGASQPFMGVVFASWNLAKLVFTSRESIGRRIGRMNRYGEEKLTYTVITLLQERRRLQFDSFVSPGSPRAQLLRNLRLEELTAHINALAGNVYPPVEALK